MCLVDDGILHYCFLASGSVGVEIPLVRVLVVQLQTSF